MAWNPSLKVADCREIAKKWGKEQVIIIALSGYSSVRIVANNNKNYLLSIEET